MRPHSIGMFDKLYLGALAASVVNTLLSFRQTQEMLAADPATAGVGSGLLIGATAFSIAISLLLWYFISRRASNVAKWILVVFTVIGLLFLPASVGLLDTLPLILTLAITALQLAALYYLFQPDAKAYLAGDTRAGS